MRVSVAVPSGKDPVGGVFALYEFANGLARRGHEVHLAHVNIWGRGVESMDDLQRYSFEPEIAHHFSHEDQGAMPPADIFFGTGAPERFGQPVLLVQGMDMLHPHIEQQAFRSPCLKVCVATWLKDAGAVFGAPPEQFRVAPMGIDRARYRLTEPIDTRRPTVAMLYSTHPAKGWDVGLPALIEAKRHRPDLDAVVFGTVEPPEALPPWVRFLLSPDPETAVREVYNRSQVFLQASHYEGFGFTAIEAMACGCALVTTDNGGSRDYAFDGETALVTGPGDASALASAIVALVDDPVRRLAMAEAGRRLVQRFDWDAGAAALERHLLDYLADPAAFQRLPGDPIANLDQLDMGAMASLVLHPPAG